MSDAGSNVRRALEGSVTKDGWREGDNIGEWARCACYMLQNVVDHTLHKMGEKALCHKSTVVFAGGAGYMS